MLQKISCTDFIVDAVRRLRYRNGSVKPGAVAGVAFHRLLENALNLLYTEEQIRIALDALILAGVALVTARMTKTSPTHRKPGSVFQKVTKIPRHVGLSSCWCINDEGERVDPRKAGSYKIFREVKVYLIADGLPVNTSKILSSRRHSRKI